MTVIAVVLALIAGLPRVSKAQGISGAATSLAIKGAKKPQDTFVYVSGGDPDRHERSLNQFRMTDEGKLLSCYPPVITPPFIPAQLVCDPVGRFLYVSEFADDRNRIAAYRIQKSGALTSLNASHAASRSPAITLVSASPKIYVTDMAFRPDGKFLYVTVGGFFNEGYHHGQIVVFRRTASGSLVKIDGAGVRDLEGPLSLVFSPLGDFAYVLQYGNQVNAYGGYLSAYRVLPDGSLRAIPSQKMTGSYVEANNISISGDGRKLYVSSRGCLTQYDVMPDGSVRCRNRINDEGISGPSVSHDGSIILAFRHYESEPPSPILMLIKVGADGKLSEPVHYWLKADNSLQRNPPTVTPEKESGEPSYMHFLQGDKFVFRVFSRPHTRDLGIAVYSLDKVKGELSLVSTTALPHAINAITNIFKYH